MKTGSQDVISVPSHLKPVRKTHRFVGVIVLVHIWARVVAVAATATTAATVAAAATACLPPFALLTLLLLRGAGFKRDRRRR